MKKFVFCLLLLVALLLSACSNYGMEPVYTVEHNGMTFTVDANQWTITHGEDVYQVQYDQSGSTRNINITYPNGGTYFKTQTATTGTAGHNKDYDPQRYVPGEILVTVLEKQTQPVKEKTTGNLLLGVLCLVVGAFNLFLPELAWRVQYGWVYKNSEPTNFAVFLNRITGILLVIIGAVTVFF